MTEDPQPQKIPLIFTVHSLEASPKLAQRQAQDTGPLAAAQ